MKKCNSKKEATTTHVVVDHGHQSEKKKKVINASIKA